MSKPVAIVTDSTAYIPQSLTKEYNINIVPSIVIWDGDQLRDGVDITPDQFYKRLKNAKVMPTTSQPSPGDMLDTYKKLVEEGYDILGYFVSKKLSGTIDSALQAKQMLPDANIEIVDSNSVAMAAGWVILEAAKAAKDGASLADCKAIAEVAREHTGVILMVDTLEFLHRGGRIGGASRLIGSVLNFKPLLQIQDGQIEPLDRVRTRKKAINKLVEIAAERTEGLDPVYLAILHANVPDTAQIVLDKAIAAINPEISVTSVISPAVGTHTGPGTLGIAYMSGYKSS